MSNYNIKFSPCFQGIATLLLLLLFSACSVEEDVDLSTNAGVEMLQPKYECLNGMAGPFPCEGYDLMGHLDNEALGGPGSKGNDSWGWTDPETGKEYVIFGSNTGTSFVDISNPVEPVLVGRLPTATVNSSWRDIKIFQNHAFIVSEATGHGMQVFDLTRLRASSGIATFTADARYTGFGSAHNIVINEDSGFAYAVGSKIFEGGPHFINIQNPKNPVAAGGYADAHYSHDAQAVIYQGPDQDHLGKELFIGSNHEEIVIIDVTDKSNPKLISGIGYKQLAYPHQGWLTDDMRYFLVGDEKDELKFGVNTRTVVLDFTDLDNPVFHSEYTGPTSAIDHNGYTKGDLYYLANYTAGVRIIDISEISDGIMNETGFFDTYPEDNSTTFKGAWNVFPYFESGNIVISDKEGGLFIIRKRRE